MLYFFKNTEVDAVIVNRGSTHAGDFFVSPSLRYVETIGTTAAVTFSVRAGSNTANSCYLNGRVAGRRYGGKLRAYLSVTEIDP